ncbi:MAG: hypothetical protein AAB345_03830 [Patescibacteria group bacterium]
MDKKTEERDNPRLVEDLEELCVDIFAHAENDYEVTLSGNGINASEASGVALAILDLLHGDGRKWRDSNEKRISKRATELRKELGEE